MKRLLLGVWFALLLAAVPLVSSFGEGNDFGEVKSPDEALSMKVLDLHDVHGLTYIQALLKNVSDREFDDLNLKVSARETIGDSISFEIKLGRLTPGEIRIFEHVFPAPASLIDRIEISYSRQDGGAY